MEGMLPLPLSLSHSLPFVRFLLLVFLISWFASYSCAAPPPCEVFKCGDYALDYPFGEKSSGCGYPTLELKCDPYQKMPFISIQGIEYYILQPTVYNGTEGRRNLYMTILDKRLREDECNLSANFYEQFWNDTQFHIADVYKDIFLRTPCPEGDPYWGYVQCNDYSYCFGGSPSNWSCESNCSWKPFHLPLKDPSLLKDPLRNLSETLLEGVNITWDTSNKCEYGPSSYRNCDFRSFPNRFSCYCAGISYSGECPDGESRTKIENRDKSRTTIILGFSIGGGLAVIAVLALFLIFRVRRRKPPATRGLSTDANKYDKDDMEAGGRRHMMGNLPIFTYAELEEATNFFADENELGDGGFGCVFLGKLKDGRTVAVKRLYQDNSRRVEQFINEVQIFSSVHHPNLVRLYGCTCPQSPVLLLVYEFLPNGTLADHLHGNRRSLKGLPWGTRLNIAIETAEALAFLHSVEPPIYHRDVKSTNILLDENFKAKVADFGLSRLVPLNVSHVTTAPQGTPGYVDPEYHQCFQLTERSDVYSFGVVLVEIISAKLAVDITRNRSEISLANMATEKIKNGALNELVDPELEIETEHDLKVMVFAVAELALQCLARERDARPDMREVAARLEEIKQLQKNSEGEQQEISTEESPKFKRVTAPVSPTSVQERWPSIASDKSA